MADPFVAEIRIFPFNFAPKGWAFCDGQILPLSQNTALFSLLGTTYGGDGKSNFALPDLQGQAPMMWGQGPGLSLVDLGQQQGSETVTLLQPEMPAHNHPLRASAFPADVQAPGPNAVLALADAQIYKNTASGLVPMGPAMEALQGGDQPHNNVQPYLTLNYCIALQGVYPPRT
jgi:microcystin-dependent protein